MSYSIEGKTAIITGAANGVGLAIARRFVDEGAQVMFADMDEEKLAAEVQAVPGIGAVSTLRLAQAKSDGGDVQVLGIEGE